jgi:S1-C subfamily serine protease
MNASVGLLERVLPTTVHLKVTVPEGHPSVPVLGAERAGTGVIVDADGIVLTVNYVVLGARRVAVTLFDGRELAGEVVGQDFATGIALVRLRSETWPALPIREPPAIAVGEEAFIVASIGDAGRRTASGGVTSVDRFDATWEYTLERALFTSAMNPGLGGGPLVDAHGRIVGVVALNLNEIARFALAIPIECYRDHRDELLRFGRCRSRPSRAWLGLFCYTLRDHVVIAGVLPGAPGEAAGLAQGDVLVTVDGHHVATRRDLYEHLRSRPAGARVAFEVYRKDDVIAVDVPSVDAEEFFA